MNENSIFDPNKTAEDNSAFRTRAKVQGGFNDPNQLDYKSLIVGDYADIRFLDLSSSALIEVPCRRVGKRNPRNGDKMNIIVRDFGVEAMAGMVDNYGTPINDCKKTYSYRLPVWVFGYKSTDKNGKSNYTEVNALRYLEFGPGLSKSLEEMEKAQGGVGAFDEKSGLPHYDVRLNIIDGPSKEIPKNYAFEPVMVDTKTRKPAASFGQSIKERFSKETIEEIKEQWPTVISAMNILETIEEVKRNLAPTDSRNQSKDSGKPLSMRLNEGSQGGNYSVD